MKWLNGKKTYITMAAAGITGALYFLGYVDLDTLLKIDAFLLPLGFGFMRAGVKKS